jgi:hypothetical protein
MARGIISTVLPTLLHVGPNYKLLCLTAIFLPGWCALTSFGDDGDCPESSRRTVLPILTHESPPTWSRFPWFFNCFWSDVSPSPASHSALHSVAPPSPRTPFTPVLLDFAAFVPHSARRAAPSRRGAAVAMQTTIQIQVHELPSLIFSR